MIGGKKIEAKDGIAVGGDVENSLLVHGDVNVFNLTQVTAEAKTLQADAQPRRLDWENTEARYDTYGVFTSGGGSQDYPTHAALTDWLQDADAPPVFALLGEYGMGKTLECQRLYCWLRDHTEAPVPRVIYLDLRKSPQFRDAERRGKIPLPSASSMIEHLIERDWVESDGSRKPDYADIKAWLAQGALLIVDGLDECLVHLVDSQHTDFLSIWIDLVSDAARVALKHGRSPPRLLVSCRTEFFKNIDDQRKVLKSFENADDRRIGCREFVLKPLTSDRIHRYIQAMSPLLSEKDAQRLIETTHNLGELSQRPITLKFIAENLPRLLEIRETIGAVNAAGLYGLVVEDALSKKDDGRHHLHPEHKRVLLSALACHLWRTGVRTLAHTELNDWLHAWLDAFCRSSPKASRDYAGMLSERLEEDLRTATLVVRQRASDTGEAATDDDAEGFGFAHSSFAEYFLAVYLADAVREDRPDDWEMAIPSVETLDFLVQQLELDQAALPAPRRRDGGLPVTLSRWAKTYRAQASELLLKYALHARGAKVQAPVLPDFRGADLRNAELRGWRFGERFADKATPLLDLAAVQWAGADLRETYFAHVRLDDGDFSGARLDLAAFQHCSAQRSDWRGSDLLGTVFRHCRMPGSHWQPLRQSHRPKVVACSGADALTAALLAPQALLGGPSGLSLTQAVPGSLTSPLTTLPPRLRAAMTSQSGEVRSVALSADGGRVVSGSDDGTVRVLDGSSGECVRELRGHTRRVNSVALSADGGLVVSGSFDGTVLVWDGSSGECLRELRGHKDIVRSVALSADGGRMVSGSYDGTMRVWDVSSGECLRELRGHTRGAKSVALSADGGRVVSGSDDGTVRVWDVSSGECLRELHSNARTANSVALSADGGLVVSGSSDGTVRVWDGSSGEWLRALRGHTRGVNSVALSADGGRVVSGSGDGTVRVWDGSSGECLRELRGNAHEVNSVALSADGGLVVSGSGDGTVRVWDGSNGECLRELRGHKDIVRSVALSVDGGRMVSGSYDGTVRVWDASSGECLRELRGHTREVNSVALSADGGLVVSGSFDGTVRVWGASSGECVRELRGHTRWVRSVALSADGGLVVSGSSDGTVRVWDGSSGECLRELRGNGWEVNSVALSADGGLVVSGSGDGLVRVWDVSSGECVRQLYPNARTANSVALSADGGRVMSGSFHGTVRVWDASSGKCVRELKNKSGVRSDVLSADGGRVVSGSEDGTVRVWDVFSGECVRELRGHTDRVWSVALSADGGRVVSGSEDGTVRCFAAAGGGAATAADLHCVWVAAVGSPNGIPSHASWRPAQGSESDTLISASGDAWRFLSWDVADPAEPSGWRRVPLQGYE
jgi:WD40 repeat protein